jgi:hypothetical protein
VRGLTSLLLAEERLQEAEYFGLQLPHHDGVAVNFHLNAFLSAARSVTFLVQKELRHVPGFSTFWKKIQQELSENDSAKFFRDLRNFSQKEGKVRIVGYGGLMKPRGYQFPRELGNEPRMLYFFADGQVKVPDCVSLIDIATACLRHTGKLEEVLLRVIDSFPYCTCYRRACTIDGAKHHGMKLSDFLEIAGFPSAWAEAAPVISEEEAFEVIAAHFDQIDRDYIESVCLYANL